MRSEYTQIRFLVHALDPIPDTFGVVTACNPDGITVTDAENLAATERLRQQLIDAGYSFFEVTGCSPDLRHQEPGFGMVADRQAEIIELGRAWRQEAVFWIEEGVVYLVPCGEGGPICLGLWNALSGHGEAPGAGLPE